MQDFLRTHQKKIIAAVGVLILCALSFALGRFNQEEHIVIQEKIVVQEKIVEKIVEVEKTIVAVDENKEKKKNVKRTVTEVTKPDGTTEKKTEEAIDEVEKEVRVEIKYVDRFVEVEKEVEKIVEVEKKVESTLSLPDWRLGAMVGVDPLAVYEAGRIGWQEVALGAEIQRRLVGPVYGGIWGMSNGTVGVQLGLEF